MFLTFILKNAPVVHLNMKREKKVLQRCNINVMLCTFGVQRVICAKLLCHGTKIYKIIISTYMCGVCL